MAVKSKKGKASIRAAAARNKAAKKSKGSSNSSSKQSGTSKAPSVNYVFDPKKETTAQYNARIERERQAAQTYAAKKDEPKSQAQVPTTAPKETPATKASKLSMKELQSSPEYKALSKDQQSAVEAVFLAVGENNAESAKRLVSAFQAAEKLADPFFKQQIRLAKDAVERGFVEIDKDLSFSEQQARRRLEDVRKDIEEQGEFLTMEEQNDLKAIEREYKNVLDTTRTDLASRGFGSSSIRSEKEQIIEETTGDLREGTRRKFGYQRGQLENSLNRADRDTSSEVARLRELAKQDKTSLFRKAEEELGTANLPSLNFDVKPLGNVTGNINTSRNEDVIGAVKNLFF